MVPPGELKPANFSKAIRGYDSQEVDVYIRYLMQSYADVYKRAVDLEKAYGDLYRKYKELSVDKDAVRNDLLDAKRASEKIVAQANEKAEIIVKASKTNCDYIINDFRRTVAAEREKLLQIQASIQSFKDTLLNECRDYIDRIEELAEITDTTLYYSSDDELVSRAIDEVKTDVRYAMVEKEQLDTVSDEEAKVDLDCYTEASKEEDASAENAEEEKTYSSDDMEKTRMIPDKEATKIGDKYMEFLDELEFENSNTDKE